MKPNPCKDCPDRFPGCHSQCDKYKAWKAEWDEIREADRKRREMDQSLSYVGKRRGRRR